jgi:F420-0:gamma-glutamyl ligase
MILKIPLRFRKRKVAAGPKSPPPLFFFLAPYILVRMEFIPIKTRILQPPQDDLFAVLDTSLIDVRECDVVVVSAKVVAIGEGRCELASEVDKEALIAEDADLLISRDYWGSPLTVKHNAFIGTAGIDASNGNGYLVRLPANPHTSAKQLYTYIKERFGLGEVGVIIADSRSQPFRYGATGIAIGFYGFRPLIDHRGASDLFGRSLRFETSDIVDGIAAGANVLMGETDECQPVVVARGVPGLTFVGGDFRADLFVEPKRDLFRVLYERFLD